MLFLWVLHLRTPELGLGSFWDDWLSYSPSFFFPKLYLEVKQLFIGVISPLLSDTAAGA